MVSFFVIEFITQISSFHIARHVRISYALCWRVWVDYKILLATTSKSFALPNFLYIFRHILGYTQKHYFLEENRYVFWHTYTKIWSPDSCETKLTRKSSGHYKEGTDAKICYALRK